MDKHKNKKTPSSKKSTAGTDIPEPETSLAAETSQPSGKSLLEKATGMVADVSTMVTTLGGKVVGQTIAAVEDASSSVLAAGGEVVEQTVSKAKQLVNTNHEQWFGDDVERIKEECGLLNDWSQTRFPSHVTQAALCAAAGISVLANASPITRITRNLMDSDRGIIQVLLRQFVNPEEIKAIDRWMGTIPGQEFAGGMFHRLAHGHDINALIALIQGNNLDGVVGWFNHVYLRDFWTPHGVPFLPFGSETVFDWLVSLGVKKTTAMGILSVNAAQVAGALLAFKASKMAIEYVREQLRKRKAQQLWDRAQTLEAVGDDESADLCYDQAVGYAPNAPEALIWVSIRAFEQARKVEDSALWRRRNQRCYQLADALRLKLAAEDKLVPFSGATLISLRGLAVTLMALSWHGSVGDKEDAFEGQRGMLSGGVNDLLEAAEKLRSGIQAPRLEKTLMGARPFSAVMNEALALRLLIASPRLLPTPHTPITIHKRITETLKDLISRNDNQSAYAERILGDFTRKYPLSNLALI